MKIKTAQATPIQLNARLAGFILLYVSSIFFVLSSAASYASNHQAGGWTDKQYSIDGSWSINVEGNQTILRLNDDFKTKRGPDLKIFLSKQSINDVTGKTATNDNYRIMQRMIMSPSKYIFKYPMIAWRVCMRVNLT